MIGTGRYTTSTTNMYNKERCHVRGHRRRLGWGGVGTVALLQIGQQTQCPFPTQGPHRAGLRERGLLPHLKISKIEKSVSN